MLNTARITSGTIPAGAHERGDWSFQLLGGLSFNDIEMLSLWDMRGSPMLEAFAQ